MSKSIRRLPSPALVVALVALVAALAGSAVALPGKNKVDRNDIQKNAVAGKQVKNDSLTGADVNESTLAQVQSAASADSAKNADSANNANHANNADNADYAPEAGHADTAAEAAIADDALRAGGVAPFSIDFKAPASTIATTKFQAFGLSLKIGCNASGQPVAAVSSSSNATQLAGHSVSSGGSILTYTDDNGFTDTDILGSGFGSGTLTYATNDGHTVTMDYGFDTTPVFNGQSGCAFWGTAMSGMPTF